MMQIAHDLAEFFVHALCLLSEFVSALHVSLWQESGVNLSAWTDLFDDGSVFQVVVG